MFCSSLYGIRNKGGLNFAFGSKNTHPALIHTSGFMMTQSNSDFNNDFGQTPLGNTGLKCQTPPERLYQLADSKLCQPWVSANSEGGDNSLGDYSPVDLSQDVPITSMFHWNQGVVVLPNDNRLEELIRFIEDVTQSEATRLPGRGKHKGRDWENTVLFTCGSLFLWNRLPNGSIEVLVSICGSALERLTFREMVSLCRVLTHRWRMKWTRMDLKARVDDYLLDPQVAFDAAEAGNVGIIRTSRRSLGYHRSFTDDGRPCITGYYGSTGSDAQTTIYNPEVKHGIKGYTDIEVRLRNEKAQQVAEWFTHLLDDDFDDNEVAQWVAGIACGHVEFIDRSSGKRASRCPYLDWWACLLSLLSGTYRVRVPAKPKTFERTVAWLNQQVFPTLAALELAFGVDSFWLWFNHLLRDANGRISGSLKALIREFKRHNLLIPST